MRLGFSAWKSNAAYTLAERLFPVCDAHRIEMIEVVSALERLTGGRLVGLQGDTTIADVLGDPTLENMPVGLDSLTVLGLLLEHEADSGTPAEKEVAREVLGMAVVYRLLGPAAGHCTWAADTVWARSIFGIVNERVRWRGGCTCN